MKVAAAFESVGEHVDVTLHRHHETIASSAYGPPPVIADASVGGFGLWQRPTKKTPTTMGMHPRQGRRPHRHLRVSFAIYSMQAIAKMKWP